MTKELRRTVENLLVELVLDVGKNVRNLDELFCIFIEDFDVEFVFESHHEFNAVEGICAEIVHEGSFASHVFRFDTELFNDNSRNFLEKFLFSHY